MQVKMSSFLLEKKETLKKLIGELEKDFKYVSVLGTDSKGKVYSVQRTGVSIDDSQMWNERGFVARVFNGVGYSEYSFNEIDESSLSKVAATIKNNVLAEIETLKAKVALTAYPIIEEEAITSSFLDEGEILPQNVNDKDVIEKMTALKDRGIASSDLIVDTRVRLQTVQVSKIFVSSKKDLAQSYIWSESYIFALARRDNNVKVNYESFSGLKGLEILDEMVERVEPITAMAVKLLDAKPIEPGEYDAICSPTVTGMIAHEAFGHGVEMDMFVKNRAKAPEYMNKPVASELVTMHDGAAAAHHMSSYLFDDEGVLGTDTVVIDKGILKAGISDTLSALRLGTTPTGNGKRHSFERKTYARMTNTFFEAGNDKLEDMIASIKHGYMLECPSSGMEDPKNWGIQCMVTYGIEIKDGKLTDNLVSPIVLTGYVPDLLKSISMVSEKVEIGGSGACGKGYKEWAKVSDGGPYMKVKVRLG
ncbi:TldD/PmbA family protein [Clostridium sp. 19966]|uniref:TldD/PmbA family protein n=1 Tax=Clostridium sp. 19966 TaxID=2768166 RepID=UPI0028DDBC7D|nr:TldD/PmbA family protein [Clostridium sp. 19966]MDT8717164.1 TldD/PmbA family protein [Clostridium sp. 19966]